jgi:L-amino acid N-acyltransferase YncA
VAYAEYVPAAYLASMSTEASTMQWLRSLADPTQAGSLVAEDGEGTVLGWTAFGLNRNGLGMITAEVQSLYVDPEHWGKGIGSALLESTVGALARAGFETAVLWTLEANDATRRFFEHRGWRFDGTRETHTAGAGVVRYARELRPRYVDPGDVTTYDSYDEQT